MPICALKYFLVARTGFEGMKFKVFFVQNPFTVWFDYHYAYRKENVQSAQKFKHNVKRVLFGRKQEVKIQGSFFGKKFQV